MNASRFLASVLFLGLGGGSAAQDPDPARSSELQASQLFVRREVNLRKTASIASESLALVAPGTLTTQLEVSPDGAFIHVKTEDDKEGWIARPFLESFKALELRAQLEELPSLDVVFGATRSTFSVTKAAAQCGKTFLTCPTLSCTADATRKLFNKDKRTFPKTTGTAKRLTHEILAALQAETDHEVGQGAPPSGAERTALSAGFTVDGKKYALGDYVEIKGFIATDRKLECGGGESVNCGLESSGGTCNQSDIHVPLVTEKTQEQWKSMVVEPISQGRPAANGKVTHGKNVDEWGPSFFKGVQTDGLVLLVRGRLFYDGEHLVNKDPAHPKGTQPKRITLWEIHPVSEILTCDKGAACDPDNAADWTRIGEPI